MPRLSPALVALISLSAHAADQKTIQQCVQASEEAQLLHKRGSLFAARQKFEACAAPGCPSVVQAECTRWLDEVLGELPGVVVVARLDGVDQAKARVLLDDQPWLETLTGKPAELEPGEHHVTVELEGQRQEQHLVANVGEKNRLLVFQFTRPAGPVVGPGGEPPPVTPPAPAMVRPTPWVPLAISGVAVIGFGQFTGLGLGGRGALDRLTSSPCATDKTCDPAGVASIRRLFVAADVSLVAGAVATGFALWQWWMWLRAPPALSVSVGVLPGSAALQVSGRF